LVRPGVGGEGSPAGNFPGVAEGADGVVDERAAADVNGAGVEGKTLGQKQRGILVHLHQAAGLIAAAAAGEGQCSAFSAESAGVGDGGDDGACAADDAADAVVDRLVSGHVQVRVIAV